MLQMEVAGTIIQLEDTDSALIVYCSEKWQGKKIHIMRAEGNGSASYFDLVAHVVGRKQENDAIYAAVFPRIDLSPRNNATNASTKVTPNPCRVTNYMRKEERTTLFPGNVTELDWTNEEW